MLEIDDKVVISGNIILRSINDKFWALDTNTGSQYKLNRISYEMLELISEERAIKEVIDVLASSYNVEKDILVKDCLELLEYAISKDIVIKGR